MLCVPISAKAPSTTAAITTRCGKMTGTGATTTGSTTGMIAHWLAQCFEQSRDPASFDNA
jgi:hypothetical protein